MQHGDKPDQSLAGGVERVEINEAARERAQTVLLTGVHHRPSKLGWHRGCTFSWVHWRLDIRGRGAYFGCDCLQGLHQQRGDTREGHFNLLAAQNNPHDARKNHRHVFPAEPQGQARLQRVPKADWGRGDSFFEVLENDCEEFGTIDLWIGPEDAGEQARGSTQVRGGEGDKCAGAEGNGEEDQDPERDSVLEEEDANERWDFRPQRDQFQAGREKLPH